MQVFRTTSALYRACHTARISQLYLRVKQTVLVSSSVPRSSTICVGFTESSVTSKARMGECRWPLTQCRTLQTATRETATLTATKLESTTLGFVDVEWSDGHSSRYNTAWLRDHCHCQECLNGSTKQRSFDSYSLPPFESIDFVEGEVSSSDEAVKVTLEGPSLPRHRCFFPVLWLRSQCSSSHSRPDISFQSANAVTTWNEATLLQRRNHESESPVPTVRSLFLDANSNSRPIVEYGQLQNYPESLRAFLKQYGIAFVTGAPVSKHREEWVDVCNTVMREYIGYPRETFWGLFWDTAGEELDEFDESTPPDTAYTTLPLNSHIDCCYLRDPPELQLFLCTSRSPVDAGGASTFLDGFSAAERLFHASRDAFWFFCETPLPFYCIQPGVSVQAYGFVIELEPGFNRELATKLNRCPPIARFRYNNDDRAPLQHLDAQTIDAFYRHLPSLLSVLREPKLTVHVQLGVGDMVIVNNHRVLHGRTAFVDRQRVLVGCYGEMSEAQDPHSR